MNKKVKEDIHSLLSQYIETKREIYFSKLVKIISPYLKSFIINILKDEYATDEVLNTTLCNIYNNLERFDIEKGSFNTWICTIAKNNSLNYLKHNKKMINETCIGISYDKEYDICDDMMLVDNDIIIYDRERAFSDFYDASVRCIELLPVEYKVYVREQLINNKSVETIAIENSVPVTSLKNWLRIGKMMLREIIVSKYGNLYEIYITNY